MKKIVSIYSCYGKCDNESLVERYMVEEDTLQLRLDILDEYRGEIMDEKEEFLAGLVDGVYIDRDGIDWDEPTSWSVSISDPEELIQKIEEEAYSKIKEIRAMVTEK